MKVRVSRRADADLQRLFDFIAIDDPIAARRVLDDVLVAIHSLAEMPHRGRPGPLPGLRELVLPSTGYVIAYRIEPATVRITTVRHGRQAPLA